MSGLTKLLNGASALAGVDIVGEWFTWYGGPGDLWVWGNLGGGNVYLEAALDITAPLLICSTIDFSLVSPSKSSVSKFNFNHGTRIRAVLKSTSSTSSGVYARAN